MVKVGTAKIAFLLHQAHGLVAELVGVIDGRDAGLRGVERAGLAGGMHGDAVADARGFFHRGFELRLGVLVGRDEARHRRRSCPVS